MLGSLVYVGGLAARGRRSTRSAIDGARARRRAGPHRLRRAPMPVPRPGAPRLRRAAHRAGPGAGAARASPSVRSPACRASPGRSSPITGQSNHAGTTPMAHAPRRRPASPPRSSRSCAAWPSTRRACGGHQVGTVGRIELHPDLVNVVAARATLTVDLRNTDEAVLAGGRASRCEGFLEELAAREGVVITTRALARFEPVAFDPSGRRPGRGTARRLGPLRCADAVAAPATTPRCWPASARPGMVFVPSAGGISHNPAEHTDAGRPRRPAPTSCSTCCVGPGRRDRRRSEVAAVTPASCAVGRPPSSGPIARDDTRKEVVERLLALLRAGAGRGLRARRLPRAGPHHVLPPLVLRRPGRGRRLVRDRDARSRDQAAVRRGRPARCRLLPRLRRAAPPATAQPLQHPDPRRARRPRGRPLPQGPPARPRATTSRGGPFQHLERRYFDPGPDGFGVWRGLRRHRRHDDLQRPPLARDLPGAGPAGRRADPVRLQHADPLRPRPEPGQPRRASTTPS